MDYFGIKELYGVVLKSTSNLEINGEWFVEDEPILLFDKIQIGLLQELTTRHYAQGGYHNQVFITWEDTKGMDIQLSEGVVSKTGLSLLSNSQLFKRSPKDIVLPYSEENLESEKVEGGYEIILRYPLQKAPFVWRNGKKITDFTWKNENSKGKILINNVDDEAEYETPLYNVYYEYIYNNSYQEMYVGKRAVNGFLSLVGRMRLKDDQSGKETTCIVEFPKVQLMSDLTMRLGSDVTPYVYGFKLMAHPVGDRGHQYVCKYTFLDEDIDADI